jgi:hypothetical protein
MGYANLAAVFDDVELDVSKVFSDLKNAVNGELDIAALLDSAKGVINIKLSALTPVLEAMGLDTLATGLQKIEGSLPLSNEGIVAIDTPIEALAEDKTTVVAA